MQLLHKSAMITGSARGIGRAICQELATAGCDILGVDLHLREMVETRNAVEAKGRKFKAFACDVSSHQAVVSLIAEITAASEGFDILVNNAAVLSSGPFLDGEFTNWHRTIEVNLTGLMAVTHAALPHLRKKGHGHIVNISSIAGKFGTEGVAAYAASKHGVVGLSSALREELREYNIGVSWICASMVNTRMTEGVPRHFLTPLVEPQLVARAVRKAIERNRSEVFVPRRVRFNVSILPSLAPDLARFISRVTGASRGWLTARKDVGVAEE